MSVTLDANTAFTFAYQGVQQTIATTAAQSPSFTTVSVTGADKDELVQSATSSLDVTQAAAAISIVTFAPSIFDTVASTPSLSKTDTLKRTIREIKDLKEACESADDENSVFRNIEYSCYDSSYFDATDALRKAASIFKKSQKDSLLDCLKKVLGKQLVLLEHQLTKAQIKEAQKQA